MANQRMTMFLKPQSSFGGRSRRRLIAWFCATLLLLWGATVTARAIAAAPNAEIRGVWITTNDLDVLMDRPQLEAAVDQLADLHFNTLYPVVWNSGYLTYPSAVAQRMDIQPFVRRGIQGYDILAELMTQAHRRGLLVLPWFEFGFMTPPTSELAIAHPDWLTQKQNGDQTWVGAAGEVVWLNPFHTGVQHFITNIVMEVVNTYDIDGIQFDDHLSLPVEFGYDRYTSQLYREDTGQNPPSDPHNPAWVQWRAQKLTAFVTQLQQAVKARKPQALFSIAPNPYDVAYTAYLQDWLAWLRQGLIDELIVQIYRDDLTVFRQQLMRPEVQEARQRIPTGVGILTGLRTRPVPISFIQDKVRTAQGLGIGVSFFYYESLWEQTAESRGDRLAGFQALFPYRASRQGDLAQTRPEPTL